MIMTSHLSLIREDSMPLLLTRTGMTTMNDVWDDDDDDVESPN
jgi:hypothetical protein